MPNHAYSTYIQTSNQAIRDQKPIKKAEIAPKPRKLHKNWKNFTKICAKRVCDFPTHLNLTMPSLGVEETQPRT